MFLNIPWRQTLEHARFFAISSKKPKLESMLKVKRLSAAAIVPTRGSALSAGYDLSSAVEAVVPARGKALVKTNLAIAVPADHYGRIAPRSGLAWKHSIDVGAGVIDADYRGDVGVILFNFSDTDFAGERNAPLLQPESSPHSLQHSPHLFSTRPVQPGDRIAQLILERISMLDVVEVDDLDETDRGEGGFGSTGVAAAKE